MSTIERIQQVETALNEVNDLVTATGDFGVSEILVAPVRAALQRRLDMLRQKFEADWADYIEANAK